MNEVLLGFSVLVIVFFLVILLGLQIQITGLSRRLDELVDKLDRPAR